VLRACWSVVTTRSLRVGRHSGAVAEGTVVASRRQGVVVELEGTTGRAPSKEGAGGAHRGGGASTGRRGSSVRRRATGSLPEEGSTVTLASSWSCWGGRER
jgi:hypothetical protein